MTSTKALTAVVWAVLLLGCSHDSTSPNDTPTVFSVTVTPATPSSLRVGDVLGLRAVVRTSSDRVLDTPITWSSSDPIVAAIRPDSANNAFIQLTKVVALTPGTTTVTAATPTKSASVTVIVRGLGPVFAIDVTPTDQSLLPGDSYQLAVVLRDADNNTLALTGHQFAFGSSAPAVATVSTTGMVTAVAPGTATLTVATEGINGTARLTVRTPPLPAHAFLWVAGNGMRDLGVLPGFTSAAAVAISTTGQVAGSLVNQAGVSHAFSWTAAGGMVDLGTLPGGTYSVAAGINSSGQIVGSANTSWGQTHAVLWTGAGAITDLGVLPGGDASGAAAINDAGTVVGYSSDTFNGHVGTSVNQSPFIWTLAGGLKQLFPGGIGVGNAINSLGQVAGAAGNLAGNQPFRWAQQSGLQMLAIVAGDDAGFASGINDAGDVVGGSSYSPDCGAGDGQIECPPGIHYVAHALLWPASGGVVNLSAKPGFPSEGSPAAINAGGQIVGTAGVRAFLWSSAGGFTDLGVLPGRTNSAAWAINAAGQVVGVSYTP